MLVVSTVEEVKVSRLNIFKPAWRFQFNYYDEQIHRNDLPEEEDVYYKTK